jgi:hypothetical protein
MPAQPMDRSVRMSGLVRRMHIDLGRVWSAACR